MKTEEAKEYIKTNWNSSNGKRITEMLLRYWKMREVEKQNDLFEDASVIFENEAIK